MCYLYFFRKLALWPSDIINACLFSSSSSAIPVKAFVDVVLIIHVSLTSILLQVVLHPQSFCIWMLGCFMAIKTGRWCLTHFDLTYNNGNRLNLTHPFFTQLNFTYLNFTHPNFIHPNFAYPNFIQLNLSQAQPTSQTNP